MYEIMVDYGSLDKCELFENLLSEDVYFNLSALSAIELEQGDISE